MMKMRGRFEECEHGGDMERYLESVGAALRQAGGGRVIRSDVNGEIEIGTVEIEVADAEAFVAAFRRTDGAGFGRFVQIVEGTVGR